MAIILGLGNPLDQKARLGIINIDAHFDMRPYENETSSGTMFKQILDEDQSCGYLCVGIQKQGIRRHCLKLQRGVRSITYWKKICHYTKWMKRSGG
ncbi:arginase family protein [Peribacillus frigoritolerans]|nr:arginase family protein [Peribacillus frigoritolerans]